MINENELEKVEEEVKEDQAGLGGRIDSFVKCIEDNAEQFVESGSKSSNSVSMSSNSLRVEDNDY